MSVKRGRKKEEPYVGRSNAVCIVAYNINGGPISNTLAAKIINAVSDVTEDERLAISFTRT